MVTIEDGALTFRQRREFEQYRPGCMRQFASLKTPREICFFADRFGPLGFDAELRTLDRWQKEIAEMSAAAEIWAAAQAGDSKRLHRFFNFFGGSEADRAEDRIWWPRRSQKSLTGGRARAWVATQVNMKLARYTSAYLGEKLEPMAHNLLGSLWLELARLIASGRPEGTCATCGEAFPERRRRTGPGYCSTTCRMAARKIRRLGLRTKATAKKTRAHHRRISPEHV